LRSANKPSKLPSMSFQLSDPASLALLQAAGGGVAAGMPVAANMKGIPSADPKTTVNTFCQRYCRKPISKTDIVYTTQKIGAVYQSVVRLNCIEGLEFAGEVASNAKDAEKNAASQALANYANEMATLPAAKNGKKRKASDATPTMAAVAAAAASINGAMAGPVKPLDPTQPNAKMTLNSGLTRILKRTLTKEDVQCNTVSTALGFQCTLSLPAMPGEWGGYAWAGEVANKKKDAEENAARHAVAALRADAEMCLAMDTPPAKAAKTNNGKGKGKGNWGKGWGMGFWGGGGKGWGQLPSQFGWSAWDPSFKGGGKGEGFIGGISDGEFGGGEEGGGEGDFGGGEEAPVGL